MKLLKKTYIQRALREEAQGNYKQAAAFYSKAEEFEKVGEMHELLGDMTRSFPDKIRAYQQALRWYKQAEHIENLAKKLAETMEIEIRADAKVSAVELHRLPKVAEYYALGKEWKRAGSIYEELGMYDRAEEMYIQGGEIESLEKIAVRKEDQDHRKYSAQHYYEEAEAAYRLGHRDRAYQALKQCLTIETTHAKALALFENLKQKLQASPGRRLLRIPLEEREYILVAKNVMTIGRKEDNDLILTQGDVSRNHARLGFHGQRLLVEDLQSSNGTRVNGLRIQRRAEIRDRDVLGIGRRVQFEVRISQCAAGISATLCPLEQQVTQRRYIFFSGDLQVGSERECNLPLQYLDPAAPPRLFKIHYQSPFWYLQIHPQLTDVELNGVPVQKYIVVLFGDTVITCGATLLFE